MRKLVVVLITILAVVTFLRAYTSESPNAARTVQHEASVSLPPN